jgi:tetraacyldisaccharide 4'-kinase
MNLTFSPGNSKNRGALRRLVGVFLLPLSWLYGAVCKARLLLYQRGWLKQEKLGARVVSVGNVTLGGTGKTPLVIYLAQKLREKNHKVAVLTRGYKRRTSGLVEITQDTKKRIAWEDVGDEPYLLSIRLPDVPIMVCKDRVASGKRAIRNFGSEILLLDDGFQHLKLKRDLDVVAIDSVNPFGNRRLLPAGILREPLSSLKRADVFVLTKADQTSRQNELIEKLKTQKPDAPVLRSVYQVSDVEDLIDHSPVDLQDLRGKSALLLSGIGNPFSFEKTVEHLNVKILKHRIFPDHFAYREKDVDDLVRQAQDQGADFIITTEKDSVRIPLVKRPGIPIYVVKIDLRIDSGEELLLKTVEGKGRWRSRPISW